MSSRTAVKNRARATRTDDPVGMYLEEIGRHPLLTPESERTLARTIAAGRDADEQLKAEGVDLANSERAALRRKIKEGRDASDLFVKSNLRLVVSVAKRYQSSGVPQLDLIQDGNLGLIRAVEKFDHEKGFRFSTYAVWWIRQFISRGIAANRSSVRLPSRANDDLLRLRELTTQLEQAFGRSPSTAELADAADLSEDRVLELQRISTDTVSLSGPVGSDESSSELGDFIEDPRARAEVDAITSHLLPDEIDQLFSGLEERERQILWLRYGFGGDEAMSVAQVAEQIGLSRERIRQLEHRAMAKLLHPSFRGVHRFLVAAD
ncbi:MAG: RNA polymerase sigma factor RpoD/SigA [Acidimicrobiales bacterium]